MWRSHYLPIISCVIVAGTLASALILGACSLGLVGCGEESKVEKKETVSTPEGTTTTTKTLTPVPVTTVTKTTSSTPVAPVMKSSTPSTATPVATNSTPPGDGMRVWPAAYASSTNSTPAPEPSARPGRWSAGRRP